MRRLYVYSLMLVLVVVQVTGHTTLVQHTTIHGDRARANPFWLLLLQDSSWNQTFGGVGNDYGYAIVEHSTGGFAIGGDTLHYQELCDFWLVMSDEDGNNLWDQSYGRSTHHDNCRDIIECSNGGFALTGWSSRNAYNYDVWLLRCDANGNQLWNRSYHGYDSVIAESLVELNDGGFALVGCTTSSGIESSDGWLIRVDVNGNHLWNRTFGGTEPDWFHSVLKLSNGFLLTGFTESGGAGSSDVFVVRTDMNGNQQWNRTYGAALEDYGYQSILCDDGGFAIGAYTENFGAVGEDFWLIRTNSSGDLQWSQTYGGAGDDQLRSITLCDEGGFALFGSTNSYGAGGDDYWLVRTNYEGNLHWNLTFGGPGTDSGMDIVYCNDDDGFALIGNTDSYGAGGTDAWLVWLEDDPPPPPSVLIPGFPPASIILGVLGALGVVIAVRRKPRH